MYVQDVPKMSSFTCWILQLPLQYDSSCFCFVVVVAGLADTASPCSPRLLWRRLFQLFWSTVPFSIRSCNWCRNEKIIKDCSQFQLFGLLPFLSVFNRLLILKFIDSKHKNTWSSTFWSYIENTLCEINTSPLCPLWYTFY